jgi:Competence protein CoiA-like family
MSIRAILNDIDVYSFDYDDESWQSLKNNHKNLNFVMPCCNSHAVPKTSKLKNYFFAHSKQGECTSAPETPEHLYLKTIIAKIARSDGWLVTTEKKGETPSGEVWIADVFCTKGNVKLAFEVQWSAQTNDEFIRRTRKYTESDVRVAWLYRLRGNKEYYKRDFPVSKELPLFGIRHNKETNAISVPQFDVLAEEFIQGVFEGKLKWLPSPGDQLIVKIPPEIIKCWKCKKQTKIIKDVLFYNKNNIFISARSFSDRNIPDLILHNVGNKELAKHGVGSIKKRYSKTVGAAYLSNGCFHCDSLMGNFFLMEDEGELLDPIVEFCFICDQHTILLDSGWFFGKLSAKSFF